MNLVRKVSVAKWVGAEWASVDRIPADALSADLKTTGNTISFWLVDSADIGDEEVLRASVAMAAAMDKAESFDVISVPLQEFENCDVVESMGRSPYTEFCPQHRDVAALDDVSHIVLAKVLSRHIYEDRRRRITRAEILKALRSALTDGRLDRNEMKDSLVKQLEA